MTEKPRTFEKWKEQLIRQNVGHTLNWDHAWQGWAARDEEVAAKDRRIEELREPMGCGHPKACWIENKRSLSHLDSFYRQLISNGMFNEDQVDSLRKDNSYCCVCAEHATLQAQIDRVRAILEEVVAVLYGEMTEYSLAAIRIKARKFLTALGEPAATPERKP